MKSARASRIEQRLREITVDLSGYDPDELTADDEFLQLGFDSLFLTQLSQAFKEAYGVDVTFRQLFEELPSLGAVAGHIDAALPPDAEPVSAGEPAAPSVEADREPRASVARAPSPEPAAGRRMADATRLVDDSSGVALDGDGVGAIVFEQLRLMTWQLELLLGRHSAVGDLEQVGKERAEVLNAPVAEAVAGPEAPPVAPAALVLDTGGSARDDGDGEGAMVKEVALMSGPPRGAAKRGESRMSPHQEKRLKALVERYAKRTTESRRLTQAYRAVHADPRTAAGFNQLWKEIVHPIVIKRSLGSKLWDVDDNEYVDILNGFGPNFFGHSAPFVVEAIRKQLERGFEVGPQTPLAGQTAELFCELTGMDRATFVCTGSEAVQAAIRAARTHTGRTRIVLFEGAYHGNFDAVVVRGANRSGRLRTVPAAPGIPRGSVEDVLVLPYGAPESLDVIRDQGDDIAAVLVEPVQSRRPDLQPREFLHELRAITRERGTVLVFDEVVTGFRCHPGGAQAHFGVEADLATYGKVVGGGMPIGVVAGRNPFMDVFDGGMWAYGDESFPAAGVTFFAGTFVRHPLAIAAAHAVLSYLKAVGPSFQARLNETTSRLAKRLSDLFDDRGVPIRIPHFSSIMYVSMESTGPFGDLLFALLQLHGVMAKHGYPSYLTAAHTEQDVECVFQAFAASVDEMQEAGFLESSQAPAPRVPVRALEPARPASEAPVDGARLGKAPDGSPAWFVPDPERPETYLQVVAEEVTR